MSKPVIKGLIPARSGSVRVKNKNMRVFANGETLLEIKIKQLLRVPELDGVIVNSDDNEMLRCAKKLGAETVKRKPYFGTATVSNNEAYREFARTADADIIALCFCTSPLLEDDTVSECIRLYLANRERHDSVNTADAVKAFLWQDNHPINYTELNRPMSQDLPDIVQLNFAVNIVARARMYEIGNFVGRAPLLHPIPREQAVDINDPLDFAFAQWLYQKRRPAK
ncbi:MAG: acylneuraminate cytidylyltransferase family protein [Verrucomicrobiales bacterium]|nr:acylneuraminate cytidylyltransferase family protein [Verrucomicrobiales bacterium]